MAPTELGQRLRVGVQRIFDFKKAIFKLHSAVSEVHKIVRQRSDLSFFGGEAVDSVVAKGGKVGAEATNVCLDVGGGADESGIRCFF